MIKNTKLFLRITILDGDKNTLETRETRDLVGFAEARRCRMEYIRIHGEEFVEFELVRYGYEMIPRSNWVIDSEEQDKTIIRESLK